MHTTMKQYVYLIAAAMILVMAGCHPQNLREEAPNWEIKKQLHAEAPDWKVQDQLVNITSSMNLIAATDLPVDESCQMAAFCDGECIGATTPVETKFGWRFYLCIYRPVQPTHPITLAYFCAHTHESHYWVGQVTFVHDAVLGLAGDPYMLLAEEAAGSMYFADLSYTLPAVPRTEKDELAVFHGNECRQLLSVPETSATARINLLKPSEDLYLRYYSDVEGKIYTSPVFSLRADSHYSISLLQ